MTEGLVARGSLGSRLHRGDDGLWYSYAQWPSEEVRRKAFSAPRDPAPREKMRAAIEEELPEVVLDSVSDFLLPLPVAGAIRFLGASPKLASMDIERSLAFYAGLGFERVFSSTDYGVARCDFVSLHFWLCSDPRIPQETGCRIAVAGIDSLTERLSKMNLVHPNGELESKPWGAREVSILDPDGNLVTFTQPVA